MAEQDKIRDYYKLVIAVIKLLTECWRSGEGKIEISITDDKGQVESAIKGGPTWRSAKVKDEDD